MTHMEVLLHNLDLALLGTLLQRVLRELEYDLYHLHTKQLYKFKYGQQNSSFNAVSGGFLFLPCHLRLLSASQPLHRVLQHITHNIILLCHQSNKQ